MGSSNNPDLFDWAAELFKPRTIKCRASRCTRDMFWCLNPDTKDFGPLAARSAIYVIQRPPIGSDGPIIARTVQRWLADVKEIQMLKAPPIHPVELRFFTSHYSTCLDVETFKKLPKPKGAP